MQPREIEEISLQSFTVRRTLPWPPNKLFLQVSQSGYVNLINGHTSLHPEFMNSTQYTLMNFNR